jgi:hypothetical protein
MCHSSHTSRSGTRRQSPSFTSIDYFLQENSVYPLTSRPTRNDLQQSSVTSYNQLNVIQSPTIETIASFRLSSSSVVIRSRLRTLLYLPDLHPRSLSTTFTAKMPIFNVCAILVSLPQASRVVRCRKVAKELSCSQLRRTPAYANGICIRPTPAEAFGSCN